MIKIVKEAGTMALPEGISQELTNFLSLCFKKIPEDRPSAQTLLSHPWLIKMSNESKLSKILL